MKLSRFPRPAVLLLPLALLTVCRASADEKETLRGITGIYVLVEHLSDAAKQDGLSEDSIRTDVELKLRLAGIKAVTEVESFATPGKPYLYVEVRTKLDGGLYAVYVNLSLKQFVVLERDKSISSASST